LIGNIIPVWARLGTDLWLLFTMHTYGDYDSHNQQGMRNERLGVDKDYGLFY
jgi:hypothetical protein